MKQKRVVRKVVKTIVRKDLRDGVRPEVTRRHSRKRKQTNRGSIAGGRKPTAESRFWQCGGRSPDPPPGGRLVIRRVS